MQKNITFAAIVMLATSGAAYAGGKEGSIGAGAEIGLNGETGGASVNYDAGKFHFGGFLGLSDGGNDDDTDFTFGARFYYHVHDTTMSDFGVGGGIGFLSVDHRGMGMPLERQSRLYFEPGVQIRTYVGTNVALSFTVGISFGLVDANGAFLGGPLAESGEFSGVNASAGIHYYFFK